MTAFFVPGKPVQQGSMRIYNNRSVHTSANELKAWREMVGWKAKEARVEKVPEHEPVIIYLTFVFVRPKSVKREFPTVFPDLDKLLRSILDGLTGIAYHDDAQVVEIHTKKRYGETPGVEVSVGYLQSL